MEINMEMNSRKETEVKDIHNGDILIVNVYHDEDEVTETPFLFVYDDSEIEWYLIDLFEFFVYNTERYRISEFYERDDKKIALGILELLGYDLIKVIPSNQVELRRI